MKGNFFLTGFNDFYFSDEKRRKQRRRKSPSSASDGSSTDSSSDSGRYAQENKLISYGIYKTSNVCFYIPEPLARVYKTCNKIHKYRMKLKFISDSFYHMLIKLVKM